MSEFRTFYMRQRGFSLLELLIALALASMILMSVSALLWSSYKSLLTQRQLSEFQQNSTFGLALLYRDVSKTQLNLNQLATFKQNDGVLFSSTGQSAYLTQQEVGGTTARTSSRYSIENDQLTIQYLPDYREIDLDGDGRVDRYESDDSDCEGTLISKLLEGQSPLQRVVLVHRYFVQRTADTSRYALYCDAGYYMVNGSTTPIGLGVNAQEFIPNVEAFKVRLGVEDRQHQTVKYMTLNEFVRQASGRYRIVSLELGLIMHSSLPWLESVSSQQFQLNGQTLALKSNAQLHGVRHVYQQVIAIRNGQ